MKQLILICILFFFQNVQTIFGQNYKTLYDFSVKSIDGQDFDLKSLSGKKVLIVNTASKCGLTPQYKELEELYQLYKDKNFVIIGFPANDFLKQEPDSNEEIMEFCTKNYGVSFPMMEKISVKGKKKHPIYKWLTSKKENGVLNADVKWNFQKFMVDENGKLIDYLSPKESPKSDKIINWINSGN